MQIGKFQIEAHAGRTGFDFGIHAEGSPDPTWAFRRWTCIFAIWWCRRCDAGVTIMGRNFIRRIGPAAGR